MADVKHVHPFADGRHKGEMLLIIDDSMRQDAA